jgi:hypothetical protein
MDEETAELQRQAEALASERGLNYNDLRDRFADDEIIEAFGVPATSPTVPATSPTVPDAVVIAQDEPAPAPVRETPAAQAQRILQENRPDLDYATLLERGYSDDEIIEAFRPGPTVAAARTRASSERLAADINAFRRMGRSAEEIARYAADLTQDATGLSYEDYARRRLSDDDIIALLYDDESVVQLRNPFLSSVARFATKTAPMAAGVYGGAQIGAAVGGPYAPVTSLLGAVIGGISTIGAGEVVEEAVFGREVPVVPGQEYAARMGRFVGETLPFAFLPHVAATRYTTPELAMLQYRSRQSSEVAALNPRITPWDSYMLSAAFRPRSLVGADTSATLVGGLAAAGAQQTFSPGDPESIVPDLVGAGVGALTPVRHVNAAVGNAWETAVRAFSNVTSSAETRALDLLADIVGRMYEESGRDPAATLTRLMETPLTDLAEQFGVDLGPVRTIVRAGDDPVIRDLFATFQNVSANLGPTRARGRQAELVQNLEGLVKISRIMASTGDPELVRTAAILQQESFAAALQLNYDAHLAAAARTAENILQRDPLARQQASVVIANAIDSAIDAARLQRDKLYGLVDNNTPSPNGFTNFAARAEEIIASTAEVRHLDAFQPKAEALRRTLNDLYEQQASGEEITVGQMRSIRSTMLNNMRAAGAGLNKDPAAERFWGQLSEAVMDDLLFRADEVFAGTDPTILNMLSANDRALLEANQFNVAFYDVFGRAFPEEILRETMAGGRRVPPELVAKQVMQGSGDATDIRYRQLDDAVEFVAARYPDAERAQITENNLKTLRSQQDTLLRLMASRTVDLSDPQNPRVNVEALQDLMRADNPNGFGPALERFPELKTDLQNAITAETLLVGAIQENAERVAARESQQWLTTLLKVDAGEAIGVAIGSPGASRPYDVDAGGFTGARNLGEIINIAKRSENPELALRGVVDTVLDRGMMYAGGGSGEINFGEFRRFLTESLGGKTESTLGVLRREGAITPEQDINIRTLLREAEIVENALRGSRPDSEVAEALRTVAPVNMVLIGRFLGAREGARLQKLAGMNTIQIPGYFARIGGQIASRIPASRKLDVFTRFMDDSEFAKIVLGRVVERADARMTVAQQRSMDRVLNNFQNYLTRTGLISSAPLVTGEAGRLDFDATLPFGAAQAATLDPAVLEQYLQSLQQTAPAPATPAAAPQPAPATLPAGAPPPAAPAAAPTAPRAGGQQGRASYAALFPNDPISPIMQQREIAQGIGSLMGGPR